LIVLCSTYTRRGIRRLLRGRPFCSRFAQPVFDWFPETPEVVAKTSGAVEEVVLPAQSSSYSEAGIYSIGH